MEGRSRCNWVFVAEHRLPYRRKRFDLDLPRREGFDESIMSMAMPPLSKFKRFDVRPLLKRGAEPLPEILSRVQALKTDAGLIIIAPILPSPLIELLGSQGFASKVERGESGSWIVYFWSARD